ncbi:hypothetical protein CEUSTIGMA_g5832.t1 [Chlamydomonas eustigma]|uniref:Ion transport domain-containing protein n=1 Tax=Chlamydomonas eustigma TaxID=1157962 RepID=A0A250X6J7_9CHLO|nr:hypothetical protein CEUSTIGMA_g5832.t1 [Chlamydomonas eustigma]|eukprot:GAX78390.1 hypothetical protein CEUSTIGMA_g5832.t1 [Chlamydomonas eustigma]
MGHPRRKGAVSPTLTSPQMGIERENDHIGPHSLNSNDVEVRTSLMPGGTSWDGDHNAASHISPVPGPNHLSPVLPKDPQIMAGSPQPDGKAADLNNAVASKLVEPRGENPYQEYTTVDQFYQLSVLRRMAIRICSNPDFEMLVTLVIFSNSVTLCLYDPLQPTDSPHNQALNWAELGMNVFYTVEAVMRGLALGGFLNYIRVPWNAFDFSMVTIGYVSILPIGGDTSGVRALRALRALRILRTITRFESLRAVVVCFLEAVPMLSAAFFLLISVLYFFGVAAVQCFNEAYHNICATEYNNSWLYENQGDDPDMFGCSTPTKEGWWWRECPTNYTCITTPESTAVNTAGFDNAGLAFITNWQIMTLTGWSFIMFRTIDNSSPFAGIYTYLLVLVSAYFLVNLFLAVLKVKFAKAQTIFMAKKANASQTKAKNTFQKFFSSVGSRVSAMSQRSSRNSLMSQKLQSAINERLSVRSFSVAGSEDNGKHGGGLVPSEWQAGGPKHRMPMSQQPASPAAISNKKVLVGEGCTEVQRIGGAVGEAVEAQDKQVQPCGGRESELDPLDQLVSDSQLMHVVEGRIEGKPLHQSSSVLVLPAPPPALSSSGTGTGGLGDGSQGSAFHQRSKQRLSVGIKFQGVPDDAEELAFKGGKRKGSESGSDVEEAGYNGQVAAAAAGEEPPPPLLPPDGLVGPAVPEDATAAMTTMDLYEFSEFVSDLTWRQRTYLIMQFRAVRLAEHPNFDNFFLTVILANAMALAVDYYGAPYEHALTEANYVFTGLFTVEVVVKLFGFGFWKFMGDPFNVFDIIIVTLAYLEIILSSVQGLSALRALRALRVLRLLKMFRYLKSLRKIGEVLVSSFGSFASIMVRVSSGRINHFGTSPLIFFCDSICVSCLCDGILGDLHD